MTTEPSIKNHLNVVSYSSVLHACAKMGVPDRAEGWLNHMVAEGVAAAGHTNKPPKGDRSEGV